MRNNDFNLLKNKQLLFKFLFWSILLVSFFLRFINFQNRWGLSYDQARDLLVSSYAMNNHLLPFIGPFSSAGSFIYGPQWYWIVQFYLIIGNNFLIGPWVVHALAWVGMTLVFYLIGKELFNKNFGLLLAFFFSVSWPFANIATNLISPSMNGIFSIISIYFFIRSIKYKDKIDLFFLGFFVANTINIHFQAIGLLILIPIALAFNIRNFRNLLVLLIGFIIPFIPLIIFDLRSNFFESKNLLDYYLYGQNRLYVPNRWLTYAGVFWPKVWASVVGAKEVIGYIFIALTAVFTLKDIYHKKIDKKIVALLISFFVIFVMLRYYKGELYENYLIFLYPFVLIFSTWVIYKIYKFYKLLAILLIILITLLNLNKNFIAIASLKTPTGMYVEMWKNQIEKKYPKDKFAVYLYKYDYSELALPIVLYLDHDKRISDKGRKIGIRFKNGKIVVINLKKIDKKEWTFINPSAVYNSIENWYSNNK